MFDVKIEKKGLQYAMVGRPGVGAEFSAIERPSSSAHLPARRALRGNSAPMSISDVQDHRCQESRKEAYRDDGVDKCRTEIEPQQPHHQILHVGCRKIGLTEPLQDCPKPVGKWAVSKTLKDHEAKPTTTAQK